MELGRGIMDANKHMHSRESNGKLEQTCADKLLWE